MNADMKLLPAAAVTDPDALSVLEGWKECPELVEHYDEVLGAVLRHLILEDSGEANPDLIDWLQTIVLLQKDVLRLAGLE